VTKLVYIGGYGHSGSTLLEYLLASSPEVIACGEVVSVPRERGRKTKCTCGQLARDCPVWGPLQTSPAALDGWTHERLTLALLERVCGAHAVMVESSKTPWNSVAVPFRLHRKLGANFQLLHIVRDPRAVSWSAIKKAGRKGKRPLMALRGSVAALSWSVSNLACALFGRMHPDRYIQIRYEDLAQNPGAVMQELFAKLMPNAAWRPEAIGSGGNRHQLYGNRMRSETLTLAEIKEDAAWKSDMPPASRALVAALTFPLRKNYGYP
jgi:hypothetical protein